MASRKVNTEGIDEELLIASIGKKRSEEQMPPPVQEQSVQGQEEKSYAPTRRDAGGKKKQQDDDYIGLYLGRNEIKTRQCVYISRDVHSVILKIVNSIARRTRQWADTSTPSCGSTCNSTRTASTNCTRNKETI